MSNEVRLLIEREYPPIFDLLNLRARDWLPQGLAALFLDGNLRAGRKALQVLSRQVTELGSQFTPREVRDAFRRDLSGPRDEDQFYELVCEMAAVRALLAIGRGAERPRLRPLASPDKVGGRRYDLATRVAGIDVAVEVKRYRDRDVDEFMNEGMVRPEPFKRSLGIIADLNECSNECSGMPKPRSKPRSMQLRGKLSKVPEQLPSDRSGIVVLFHEGGFGDRSMYIQGALFGDGSALSESMAPTLYEDGLFRMPSFSNVSALVLAELGEEAPARLLTLWLNPGAAMPLADEVIDRFGVTLARSGIGQDAAGRLRKLEAGRWRERQRRVRSGGSQ